MAERLLHAGMNTLVGLTVVFAVLVLISFIISLLKYTYKLENYLAERSRRKEEKKRLKALKKAKTGKTEAEELVDKTFEQIVQKEELSDKPADDVSDDMEIVAVITAAICAATGCSSDSFVVRSVRKVRKKG